MVSELQTFCQNQAWDAQIRRRNKIRTAGGFRLVDALAHVYRTVPGLYQAGFSKSALVHLFVPRRLGTKNAALHDSLIDARVEVKRNSAREISRGTHV